MNTETLRQLKSAVAQLIETPVADISLEKITSGLSHNSFFCQAGIDRYFVKLYAFSETPIEQVMQINQTCEFMRQQGIPAPELVAYSPKFANVVVHRFVDADKFSWNASLVAPVAKLYSDIVSIALRQKKFVSKSNYLKNLQALVDRISQHRSENIIKFPELTQRALKLSQQVHLRLTQELPDQQLVFIYVHDDLTEKNILADDPEIKLLCDWDSFRAKGFLEHLACTAARFSTQAAMQGKLERQRLSVFLNSISPTVIRQIEDDQFFAQLFPFLAILKHLRTFQYRSLVVTDRRPDLEQSLLHRPIEHCEWMLDQADTVSEWVCELLKECRRHI